MARSWDSPDSARPDEPSDADVDRMFKELTDGLAPPVPRADAPTPKAEPATGPRDYELAPDDSDEAFVPPQPPPLTSSDPLAVLAWSGAIGGPIVFLMILIVWDSAPTPVWLTLLAATLAGWAVALWRLPRSRDDDDDGAVV